MPITKNTTTTSLTREEVEAILRQNVGAPSNGTVRFIMHKDIDKTLERVDIEYVTTTGETKGFDRVYDR